MTRKDYVLLSDTLRAHFTAREGTPERNAEVEAQEVSLAIGLALEKDNPNFDLKRFLLACEGAA
jgi:hypothetical protein